MNLVEQLLQLATLIQGLQQQLQDAQASADALAKAKYDEGFAAGVASVGVVNDKIYSQAELDAKLLEVVEPLNVKIAELEVKVANMEQIIADKVNEFKAAYKAELLAKYNELQVAETAAEVGFADLLK